METIQKRKLYLQIIHILILTISVLNIDLKWGLYLIFIFSPFYSIFSLILSVVFLITMIKSIVLEQFVKSDLSKVAFLLISFVLTFRIINFWFVLSQNF